MQVCKCEDFLQLGEEPPAFVVSPFTLLLLCAATITIVLMRFSAG